ncbi:Putative lipid carrier protein [hydrothermal vent metagenome]|uniref:Lipid carrier protein n=1 Tax=hydrothermal vent metagenome TaxID=652676 RepID=A0A3B1B967_9ZZZZ
MTTSNPTIPPAPTLPRPLAWPLGLIPMAVHSTVLVTLLNRVFAAPLQEGEMDFLEGKIMLVRIRDAGLRYRITLSRGKLAADLSRKAHDLSIEGSIYDFLLLATRREDADTLFFNRRLRLGGNTELGLYIKNFLDAFEIEGRWANQASKLLEGATKAMGRFG